MARIPASRSGSGPRSAARRAAMPSSSPRNSIASATSACRNVRTRKPPRPRSSNPSSARRARASRTGVREIRSVSASGTSSRRCPPASSPLMIRRRSSISARIAWVFAAASGIRRPVSAVSGSCLTQVVALAKSQSAQNRRYAVERPVDLVALDDQRRRRGGWSGRACPWRGCRARAAPRPPGAPGRRPAWSSTASIRPRPRTSRTAVASGSPRARP